MSLSPGVRLGPYEILSAIGAGGMGGYRARDTKLGRNVALKVIPDTFALAPDGQRFLMIKEGPSIDQGTTPQQVVIVQNWNEELKKLVPRN